MAQSELPATAVIAKSRSEVEGQGVGDLRLERQGRAVVKAGRRSLYLECKLVAHHHTGPLGATKLFLLMFEGAVFEDSR